MSGAVNEAVCRKILEKRTDVFPSKIFDADQVERLPTAPDFQNLAARHRNSRCGFITFLQNFIIYFRFLKWDEKLSRHFCNVGQSVMRTDEDGEINENNKSKRNSWHWATNRLARTVDTAKNNTDVRTSYKWNINYFLVKSCFTFGQRKVAPGTSHIFQVGTAEINFYYISKPYERRVAVKEKYFNSEDQFMYSKVTLLANTAYLIPENTVYIIYCANNSFFSLYVVKNDKAVPFTCEDPFIVKKRNVAAGYSDTLYNKPPPTPQIEDLLENDDEPTSTFNNFPTWTDEEPRQKKSKIESSDDNDGECTSSGQPIEYVLLSFSNGQTDLMPPPPPPPPQEQNIVFKIELGRNVNIVPPEIPDWYAKNFKYFERGAPPAAKSLEKDESEPLDLRYKPDPAPSHEAVLNDKQTDDVTVIAGPSHVLTQAEIDILNEKPVDEIGGPSHVLTEAEMDNENSADENVVASHAEAEMDTAVTAGPSHVPTEAEMALDDEPVDPIEVLNAVAGATEDEVAINNLMIKEIGFDTLLEEDTFQNTAHIFDY